VFSFDPTAPVALNSLIPGYTHPTSTKNPLAQQYFDQGLILAYAFNRDASYRSFQKAAELDPEFAMAYWGMALAAGADINMAIDAPRAQDAYNNIQRALVLSKDGPEHERDYIEALAKRYSTDPQSNFEKLAQDYSDAMKKVSLKYPDDPDATTLYVESYMDMHSRVLWDQEGEPMPGTSEIVVILERIIKNYPDHLGANHYYIHVIEGSAHPEKGLMSSQRIATILPNLGHLLHMPAHIYALVGYYHQAVEANEAAVAADRNYIKEHGIEGTYPLHYLSHNLYFLNRAYLSEGNYEGAKRSALELNDFFIPHMLEKPMLMYYATTLMLTELRFRKWEEVLAISEPAGSNLITKTILNYGRALAYTGLGDQANARKEKEAFIRNKDSLAAGTMFGYNKASVIMTIAENVLNASIEAEKYNLSGAEEYLRKAVALQDTLAYKEPPDWYFPVRESLGGILLRQEKFAEAEAVFRKDLAKHPLNGRSLFGLHESLKGQNRNYDAAWVKSAFDNAWKYSDTPLQISDL